MVEVWRDNWPSVMLFLACEGRWNTAATMAGIFWIGIDLAQVDVILRLRSRDERRAKSAADLVADLLIMESAALPILNEVLS